MKNVYVETKNGFPINADIQNAIDGFEYLGYDIKGFTRENMFAGAMDHVAKSSPFVGSIDTMKFLFKRIGKYPTPIDFPDEIIKSGLLNREIRVEPLSHAISKFMAEKKSVFIKPIDTKLFDGILVTNASHLCYFRGYEDAMVIVTDKIDILSEHRIYVHKGRVVYGCNYSGDFKLNPNWNYIDMLIKEYKSCPVAYTIDVALLNDRSMTVVEVNDFWAIGSYGLKPWDYAEMLLDRYNEIIK